jgi:hypothetical protein
MKIIRRDDTRGGFQVTPLKITFVNGANYTVEIHETSEPADKKTAASSSNTEAAADEQTDVSEAPAEPTTAVEVVESASTDESSEFIEPEASMAIVSYEEIPEATVIDVEPTDAAEPAKSVSLYPSRTLEIKISVPNIPQLEKLRQSRGVTIIANTPTVIMLGEHLRSIPRRRLGINFALCLVVIVLLGNTHFFSGSAPQATGSASEEPKIQRGSPTFPTISPAGKAISTLGGWARISPPDRDPVYAYVDKIGGVQVNVSEQPLPASFKGNPDQQLSQLAQNFDATSKVTAGGSTVYIGTSAKGPQSVLLTKSNLLILIKSTSPIDNAAWTTYINSLQ